MNPVYYVPGPVYRNLLIPPPESPSDEVQILPPNMQVLSSTRPVYHELGVLTPQEPDSTQPPPLNETMHQEKAPPLKRTTSVPNLQMGSEFRSWLTAQESAIFESDETTSDESLQGFSEGGTDEDDLNEVDTPRHSPVSYNAPLKHSLGYPAWKGYTLLRNGQ